MDTIEIEIEKWLSNGDGDGDGYGSGSGSGSGDGSGDGSGSGYGDGSGYGSGYGDGIKEINGEKVWEIDDTPTVIHAIKGNIAKASTIKDNSILVPCYVAKFDGFFAHGETAHEAMQDAMAKAFESKPTAERIAEFLKKFKQGEKIPAKDLYQWHGILTGSCRFGRDQFVQQHNIDIENDSFTIAEFVALTETSYGADTIKELKKQIS